MTLDSRFFVTSDIANYQVNKTDGTPLSNGYIKFYRDSQRVEQKDVYQLSGSLPNYNYTSLGSRVDLSSTGTTQNNQQDNVLIYYYPYITNPLTQKEELDLYYIEVYDNNDILQYTREAWPNLSDEFSLDTSKQDINQISNNTFINTFLNPNIDTVIQFDGTIDQEIKIAPDWSLVATGTGTITASRIEISGSDQIESSPPYALKLTLSPNVTNVKLMQKFSQNSGLWASTSQDNIYLSGMFLARSESSPSVNLGMYYVDDSLTPTPVLICDGDVSTVFTKIRNGLTSPTPLSSNTNKGFQGSSSVYISIPDNSSISITSLNLFSLYEPNELPNFSLDSSKKVESSQCDFYLPALSIKTEPNILSGWDFSVNPYNDFTSGLKNSGTYVTDQTIVLTSAGQYSATHDVLRGLLVFTLPTQPFSIAQYLDGANVKKLLGQRLSVNLQMFTTTSQRTVRVYLLRSGSTGSFPVLPSFIGSVNGLGEFIKTDPNWTFFDRDLGVATALTEVSLPNNLKQYGFNGWYLKDVSLIDDTDKFCIVVTCTSGPIGFKSINLSIGDIPCLPSYESLEQSYQKCARYYQKSFQYLQSPAQSVALNNGETASVQIKAASQTLSCPVFINYPVEMRSNPIVTTYSPVTASNQIYNQITNTNYTSTTVSNIDKKGFVINGTSPSGSNIGDICSVHWSSDARIGVV